MEILVVLFLIGGIVASVLIYKRWLREQRQAKAKRIYECMGIILGMIGNFRELEKRIDHRKGYALSGKAIKGREDWIKENFRLLTSDKYQDVSMSMSEAGQKDMEYYSNQGLTFPTLGSSRNNRYTADVALAREMDLSLRRASSYFMQ